jgi:hypothetical protein
VLAGEVESPVLFGIIAVANDCPQGEGGFGSVQVPWCREFDLLPGGMERVVAAETSLSGTVHLIMPDVGLASEPTSSRI